MPIDLLVRLIELLIRGRKPELEDRRLNADGRPFQPWDSESARTARTNRPYPGT
jgi:hypothetical protein